MGLDSTFRPQVSILLPTHNRADVLPFAIRSVLAQTVQDFELLVVGDGCTDNTPAIVQNFDDSRIHWFDLPKAPNFGYANRNIVLEQARGKYVAFMAHDDLWFSDHLELLLSFFGDEKIEIVYSRPLWVIPLGMIVPGKFDLNHRSTLKIFLNGVANGIPASSVIHRRDSLSKYGSWNEQLSGGADWDLWRRIINGGEGKNLYYLNDPTCIHFKAGWRNETYDNAYNFRIWKRLFASGQMPASLKLDVKNGITEQQAAWDEMSSDPQEWNNEIRLSIQKADTQIPLGNIKDILALRLYEALSSIYFVRKFYYLLVKPVRTLLTHLR